MTRTLGLAFLIAAVVAPAAGAAEITSGPLRAEIGGDPWRLAFHGPGGVTLEQAPGTGTGPSGTLGFRTAAGWRRATRVVSDRTEEGAYLAELETTDPEGRRLAVRIAPAADGVLAVEAAVTGSAAGITATGIAFVADPSERYLGFGERSNAVDQRGNEVENYVAEGPYQPEERPFLYAFVPPWGYHPRDDATYFPMPWLLSTRGYGVLVDNDETSRHLLGSADRDAWSVEVDAPRLRFRVFAGPRPVDVLGRLTEAVGRQPAPAAPWQLGAWFHTGQANQVPLEEERRLVKLLRDADAPVSAVETHMRYLPCGAAVGRREGERARTAFFHEAGLATLTYFNPEICTAYEPVWSDAVSAGVLQKDSAGDPYVFSAYVGDRTPPQTPVGQIDFTAAGAFDFFSALLSQATEDGHDGWMEDFGEYTPPDAHAANGETGATMHNAYPVHYHRAGYEFARRQGRPIIRHVRSGWTGVAPYAQIVWGGDPTTDWGFDGLGSAVKNGLSMGLSGISSWGSDIGGFFSLGLRQLTPELLVRWIQFGAVSGVMRTKAGGVAIPAKQRPQVWEPAILPHWRRWAHLRTQLYPYLVAADAEYRASGLPIMRHLALVYPADREAAAREDEYLFGPDLLAAPVVTPGQRRRRVYLPAGEWVDLWRSAFFEELNGGIELEGGKLIEGGRGAVLPAPLAELPLLVRAGSVIPLLPRDVDTLSDYGAGDLVHLRERRGRLDLLAFPRGRRSARLYERERLVSTERRGRWDLRIRGARTRSYHLQAALGTLRRPFIPCGVQVGRRRLGRSSWTYDPESRVLRVAFRVRRGTLRALARC